MPVSLIPYVHCITAENGVCMYTHTYTQLSEGVSLLINNGAMVAGGSELTWRASYRILLNVPIYTYGGGGQSCVNIPFEDP